MASLSTESLSMSLDFEQPPFPADPDPRAGQANTAQPVERHGTVETCEFEQLLERAMEILRARGASAGSSS